MHTRGCTNVLCTPHPSHACVRQRTGRGSGTASPERLRGHPANTQSDRPAKCGHMSGGGASGPAGPPAPAPPSIAPLTASVAIVDEAFLCLLPPASKLASASASALVSAVHLRDVPRFLPGRRAALTPEGVGDEGALVPNPLGGQGGAAAGEEARDVAEVHSGDQRRGRGRGKLRRWREEAKERFVHNGDGRGQGRDRRRSRCRRARGAGGAAAGHMSTLGRPIALGIRRVPSQPLRGCGAAPSAGPLAHAGMAGVGCA